MNRNEDRPTFGEKMKNALASEKLFHGEGNSKLKLIREMILDAVIENITPLTDAVNEELEKLNCSLRAQNQIDIVIDEVFANIASYAYGDKTGKAIVRLEHDQENNDIILIFIDEGMPFDPLKNEDPDVTLGYDKREIGGLGVFIVKKLMNKAEYRFADKKNILILRKNLD
ncbi:MAG: ATP-binding protein [Erysipelotrichaceae bacterium]|nr:ATP-binding protein [Erysipelotrichaceae bacterium]